MGCGWRREEIQAINAIRSRSRQYHRKVQLARQYDRLDDPRLQIVDYRRDEQQLRQDLLRIIPEAVGCYFLDGRLGEGYHRLRFAALVACLIWKLLEEPVPMIFWLPVLRALYPFLSYLGSEPLLRPCRVPGYFTAHIPFLLGRLRGRRLANSYHVGRPPAARDHHIPFSIPRGSSFL